MKTLITGGAGFIGSNLVAALAALGAEVRVLDNFSNGLHSNLAGHADVEVVEGDILDRTVVDQAAAGCEYVFHLAALGSVPRSIERPGPSYEVNLVGSVNVFDAARKADVKRIVYSSSSSVYGNTTDGLKAEGAEGDPISPYAASKAAMELAARTQHTCYGTEVLGLRFFNVFGPFQRPDATYAAVVPLFTDALLSGRRPKIFGDGEQIRDFTYVDDVVQALLLAATVDTEASGEALNVSVGRGHSVLGLFEGIQAATGVYDIEPEFAPEREGDIRMSRADITQATARLGFQPTWTVEDGLKQYVSWYNSRR